MILTASRAPWPTGKAAPGSGGRRLPARFGVALALCSMLGACESDEPPPPPTLLNVPSFALTRQDGASFGTSQLRGRVWIANFIFTRCPTICPLLTSQMKGLTEQLDDTAVRFVSFSVDPAHDTPAVLARYAADHSADTGRWAFVTGDSEAIEEIVVRGLKMYMGDRDESGNILHGSHFVLVDRSGAIRGYYSSNPEGLEDLVRDTRQLVQ